MKVLSPIKVPTHPARLIFTDLGGENGVAGPGGSGFTI